MAGLVPAIHVFRRRQQTRMPRRIGDEATPFFDGYGRARRERLDSLSLDLGKIRHGARRGADFVEQFQPVLAQRLVVDIDRHLVEEGIDMRAASFAMARMAASKSSFPTARVASALAASIACASAFSSGCL